MTVAESAESISPSVPAVSWDWGHLAEYTRPAVTQLTQGTLPHMLMMDISKQELGPRQIRQNGTKARFPQFLLSLWRRWERKLAPDKLPRVNEYLSKWTQQRGSGPLDPTDHGG